MRLIGDELLQNTVLLFGNLFTLIKKRPTTTTKKIISTTHKTKLPNEQCLGNSEVVVLCFFENEDILGG